VVICLERGADLHMAQLMSLPLTISCFSKIHIGFTFLVPVPPGRPGKRAVKRVCVFGRPKLQIPASMSNVSIFKSQPFTDLLVGCVVLNLVSLPLIAIW